MRAVRYHEAGDPSVLAVEDVERPAPGPGEVLVEIRAASVNPTDALRRSRGTGPVPKTSGSDFAGVVEAVGPDVDAHRPGDRVCGTGLHTTRFHQGSFAEYAAVPTDVVTPLPDGVSFEEGAAVALVGVTAWLSLFDHAGVQPTDDCLVHGGTGGVGHVAVQLAARIGTHTVTTAHPDRRDDAAAFGADAVLDYTREDLLDAVDELSTGGYDAVLDHRAHDYFTFDVDVAAFRGTVVLYGGIRGETALSNAALRNDVRIQAFSMSNLVTSPELPSIAGVLRRVLALVDAGELAPRISRSYGLDEAVDAHRAIEEDSFVGKAVVLP